MVSNACLRRLGSASMMSTCADSSVLTPSVALTTSSACAPSTSISRPSCVSGPAPRLSGWRRFSPSCVEASSARLASSSPHRHHTCGWFLHELTAEAFVEGAPLIHGGPGQGVYESVSVGYQHPINCGRTRATTICWRDVKRCGRDVNQDRIDDPTPDPRDLASLHTSSRKTDLLSTSFDLLSTFFRLTFGLLSAYFRLTFDLLSTYFRLPEDLLSTY
jgi:hypothetical protein